MSRGSWDAHAQHVQSLPHEVGTKSFETETLFN